MAIDEFTLLKAEYLGKLEGAISATRRTMGCNLPLGLSSYISVLMVDFAREAKTLGEELADKEWKQIMAQKEKEEGC